MPPWSMDIWLLTGRVTSPPEPSSLRFQVPGYGPCVGHVKIDIIHAHFVVQAFEINLP